MKYMNLRQAENVATEIRDSVHQIAQCFFRKRLLIGCCFSHEAKTNIIAIYWKQSSDLNRFTLCYQTANEQLNGVLSYIPNKVNVKENVESWKIVLLTRTVCFLTRVPWFLVETTWFLFTDKTFNILTRCLTSSATEISDLKGSWSNVQRFIIKRSSGIISDIMVLVSEQY